MKFSLSLALILSCICSAHCLGTKKASPLLKRQKDLVTSIEIIKSDFDIPKANKEKIFQTSQKSFRNVRKYFATFEFNF